MENGSSAVKEKENQQYQADVISYEDYESVAAFVRSKTRYKDAETGIICGTGLGGLVDTVVDADVIPYQDIPHFPKATALGHKGQFVIGLLSGKVVMCMQGRIHPYEGYSLQKTTSPIRIMHFFGVKTLIITNAAGGMNMEYRMGDFMLVKDHVYLPGLTINPLIGPNEERFGDRFVIMEKVYCNELRKLARKTAEKLDLADIVREGVYFMLHGPMFLTNAEIGITQKLGADAIGMSTCPEVTVAAHCKMRVLAISVITDALAQYDEEPVNHQLVLREGEKAAKKLQSWVTEILKEL